MCDDGYWAKNGRCEACESQSKWLIAPVSISIGVIGALATYKFTGHRVSESFTAQLLLTCTVGLAVRFAQLLVVLGTFHPSLPKDIIIIIITTSMSYSSSSYYYYYEHYYYYYKSYYYYYYYY